MARQESNRSSSWEWITCYSFKRPHVPGPGRSRTWCFCDWARLLKALQFKAKGWNFILWQHSPLIFKPNLHKTICKGSWDIKEYIERVKKHWSFLCWRWDLKCKHVLPHPNLSCIRRAHKKKAGHLSSPPHISLVWSDDPRDSDTRQRRMWPQPHSPLQWRWLPISHFHTFSLSSLAYPGLWALPGMPGQFLRGLAWNLKRLQGPGNLKRMGRQNGGKSLPACCPSEACTTTGAPSRWSPGGDISKKICFSVTTVR